MEAVVQDKIGTTEIGFGHNVAAPLAIWNTQHKVNEKYAFKFKKTNNNPTKCIMGWLVNVYTLKKR